jgi:dihydroneopterin aldolase
MWGWGMDRRFILQGLECKASIGIYDAERARMQRVKIDAEVRLYPSTEPVDDRVESTLNYDLIRETILTIVSARHYDLQETLARHLFDALQALDDVQSVRIRTSKPDAYDDCETIAYQLSNL